MPATQMDYMGVPQKSMVSFFNPTQLFLTVICCWLCSGLLNSFPSLCYIVGNWLAFLGSAAARTALPSPAMLQSVCDTFMCNCGVVPVWYVYTLVSDAWGDPVDEVWLIWIIRWMCDGWNFGQWCLRWPCWWSVTCMVVRWMCDGWNFGQWCLRWPCWWSVTYMDNLLDVWWVELWSVMPEVTLMMKCDLHG